MPEGEFKMSLTLTFESSNRQEWISLMLTRISGKKKSDAFSSIGAVYYVVPRTGIEPVRVISPQDFKSCASTDFATWAEVVSRMGLEPMAP